MIVTSAIEPGFQCAAIFQIENLCRICRTQLNQFLQINNSFVNEFGKGETDGGFESGDAERCAVVLRAFSSA